MKQYLLSTLLFLSASFINQGTVFASQASLQEKGPSDPLENVYRHITHPFDFEDELNGCFGSLFTSLEVVSKHGYLRFLSPSLELISKLSNEIIPFHLKYQKTKVASNQEELQAIHQTFLTSHSALVTLLSFNPFTDTNNPQQSQQFIGGLICAALDDLILEKHPGYENQKQSYLAIDQFNDALEQAKNKLNKQDEEYTESLLWNYSIVRGILETLLDFRQKRIEVGDKNEEEVKLPQTEEEWMNVITDKFEIPTNKIKALLDQRNLCLLGQKGLVVRSNDMLDKATGLLINSKFKEIPDDVKNYIMSYRIDESYNKKVLGGKEKEPLINKNIYQQMVGASRESRKVWRVIANEAELKDYLENVKNNGILKSVSWVIFFSLPTPEQIEKFVDKQIKGVDIMSCEDLSSDALKSLKKLPNLEVVKIGRDVSREIKMSQKDSQLMFESLSQCPNLKELHLRKSISITSLAGIEKIGNLDTLIINYSRDINDLSPLCFSLKLKKLILRRVYEISSLEPLYDLPDLKELDLDPFLIFHDYNVISEIEKLRQRRPNLTIRNHGLRKKK